MTEVRMCSKCGQPETNGHMQITWRTSSGGVRTRDSEFVHYDGTVCLLESELEGEVGLTPPKPSPLATSSPSMWGTCTCGHSKIHHDPTGKCGYGMSCSCVKFETAPD